MASYALIVDGRVWCVEEHDEAPVMHEALTWVECTGNDAAVLGATYADGTFVAPVAPPAGPRYVKLALIRLRLIERGKFEAFAEALDTLPSAQKWSLRMLEEGIASDDPDASALLQLIGEDPAEILAP